MEKINLETVRFNIFVIHVCKAPLHYAVSSLKMVTFLIENGAQVDVENKAEFSPLCFSIANEKVCHSHFLLMCCSV